MTIVRAQLAGASAPVLPSTCLSEAQAMTKVSEKSSDIRRVAMQTLLYIAGGYRPLQKSIRRAEEGTGLKQSRVKNCWYADSRVAVRKKELRKARAAALEVS